MSQPTRPLAIRFPALALALSLCSCANLLSFDVDQSATTTVPKASGVGAVTSVVSPSFGSFNLSQTSGFQNQNTSKDHISEVHVTRLTLTVTNPQGNDLSFFQKIDLSVEAPNLPKQHIAGATSFPKGQTSVDLTLDNVDIAPYAKASSFSITTQAQGTSPQVDTTVRADIRLNVHASVL